MVFPKFKGKHKHDAMFSPKDYIAYRRRKGDFNPKKIPEGVIICYDPNIFDYLMKSNMLVKYDGMYAGGIYEIKGTGNKVGIVYGFGTGSPIAVIVLEELIAIGVKRFVNIGSAGTLQKRLKIGDIVVCDKAIRDEGTSHHYLKSSKYSFASKKLTSKLENQLKKEGLKYVKGTSWTIDAPYRETISEAKQYQKEGVLTVEMEASALFAVASVRKVEIASMFTVSDSLADLEWKPEFHSNDFKKSVVKIYEVAKNALLS
ncbi:MAG: nucleoside phosphorylase [archaeon]